MRRTHEEIAALKARVRDVRTKFEGVPSFKWLPTFRKEHPQYSADKIRNVYYTNSANEDVTRDLELFWLKYKPSK